MAVTAWKTLSTPFGPSPLLVQRRYPVFCCVGFSRTLSEERARLIRLNFNRAVIPLVQKHITVILQCRYGGFFDPFPVVLFRTELCLRRSVRPVRFDHSSCSKVLRFFISVPFHCGFHPLNKKLENKIKKRGRDRTASSAQDFPVKWGGYPPGCRKRGTRYCCCREQMR